MKWYLAGPMQGRLQSNIPLFERAATELRAAGIDVISPVELDTPEVRERARAGTDGGITATDTWGRILARDVQIVADDVQGLIFLPDWHASRGARLEAFTALLVQTRAFAYYAPGSNPPFVTVSPNDIRNTLKEYMP